MVDPIQRRDFLKLSALVPVAATGGALGVIDSAAAAPAEQAVSYQVSGKPFEGLIVYDSSVQTKRPIIFMQPDWYGVSADNIAQARLIAGKEYVVLMADMFGSGYAGKTKSRPELAAAVGAVHGDLGFTVACGRTAFIALSMEADKLGIVDTRKRVAIGYCAGAGFLVEHARAGADYSAIVVFHITNPNPSVAGTPCNIKGRVLAIHGSADPVTPKAKMDAFGDELAQAKVDWQVMMIGGMTHELNEKNRRKAYMLMHDFFAETI